jgi:hypothetical protein
MSILDWIMAPAEVVEIKTVKERRVKEKKKRRSDVRRTGHRAMNPRRR